MQDNGRGPEDTEMISHILKRLYLLRAADVLPAVSALYTSVSAYPLSYNRNSQPRHKMDVTVQFHVMPLDPREKWPQLRIGLEAGWAPEPVWTLWGREKSPAPVGNQSQIL
jgi:hypothetical protein